MTNNPNYYAIIPANVRYADITPNAKLLYGEITALCNREGYCWANNTYFASLYKVANRSITKWIKELEVNGFISIGINKKEGNLRKLYLSKKCSIPIEEKFHTPIEEKFYHNNTSINNTSNKESIMSDFEDFWKFYTPIAGRDGKFTPRGSRKESERIYRKKISEGFKSDDILAGLKKYLEQCKSSGSLTCQATTFLNQHRWADDYETQQVIKSTKGGSYEQPKSKWQQLLDQVELVKSDRERESQNRI